MKNTHTLGQVKRKKKKKKTSMIGRCQKEENF